MTTECSKVDSRNGPLRRSSSKGLKGLIHIFRSGSTKASGSKLRIPSFRGDRKRLLSSQKHQEPDNLLKEIPSLDFQKLKTDLYIDLAYTNNLLRQRVHRDNLTNLVAQITECLRLIRCRVATAAAYIQTDSLPASSASHGSRSIPNISSASSLGISNNSHDFRISGIEIPDDQYYSENRVILEAVSRFENAYFAFAGWLTELAALKPSPMNVFPAQLGGETTVGLQPSSSHSNSKASILVSAPLARPYSGNEIDSLHNSTVVTPDDVGEVMARGNACFLAIQTAAESVFLSLEVSGCTRPTTPQALSCVNGTQSPLSKAKQTGFLSFHFPRATPSLPGKGPTPNGTPKPPELHRGGGLTLEDRHLLAQLWSLAEPMTDTSPPPKPPLCLGPPQWSSSASMVDLPPSPLYNNVEEGYINVCADVKLNAYLRSLANAVQLTSVIQLNPVQKNNLEESVYSNIDSPGVMEPPLDPTPPDPPPRNNAKQNGCLDLNSLNLPHADDSDASEKENEERKEEFHGGIQIPELTVSLSAVHPHSSTTSLPPPASALPPPYPSPPLPSSVASQRPPHAPATSKCDQNTKKLVEVQNKNSPSSNKPWEPLESTTLPSNIVASLAKREINPLSDASMQGEVMEAVRRVQCESNKETCLQHDSEGTNHSNLRLCLNQSANDNGGDDAPFCHAETKSDTEDDFELIFANGRKYKRYFKRHIVFQRHVCKQIVVAPSLPDGSGPDLSRQVAQGPVQGCHFDNSAPRRETPTPTGSCQLSSSDDTESGLQATTEGEAASTSTSHSPRLWEPVGNGEKPRTPSASPFNNTLTNYMYKFGRSDPQDSGLESRIYRNFADFFHPKWCKRETAQGPHERSKTVAYVHKYSQPALTGPPIQHNTCVQETCTVRMVGGLNELRQQPPSIPIVYTPTNDRSADDLSTMATSCGPNASTLPRPHKGRSLSRGRVQVVDRRKQRTRPTSSLLLLSSETEGPKGGFTIEVPSGSQPLLTELPASPEVTFRHRWPQRKGSLESSSLRNEGEKNENNQLLPPISLIETELPSVEEAEKLHPLLMELDATPFLDMDQSHTDNELQIQAGTVDALIVYATSLGRSQRSFLFTLDVFLVTYRTFITSEELISRLIQRYLLFQSNIKLIASVDEKTREKICNVVISYLIRVISQLSTDLNSQIYSLLTAFRERVMDDGYGSLARAIDFTLSNQIKRRSSTQNQEHRSATSSLSTPPPPSEELSSPGLCVRRSHSIGTVAGAMVSLPSPTKNGGFNLSQKPTVPAAIISSARNSFSIVAGEESSFQSSPAVSTAALSDIDFESTARPSTVSCFSSPATSRRLLGPATPLALATLHRHSQASRRSSLLDIPAKQLAEQITYLEAAKYGRLTLQELLDIKSLAALKAPVMAACAAQFTALSNWAATLLLAPPASQRERHATKLLKVMDHLHSLKNFNSFLAILCAFLLIPENIFSKKTRTRLTRLRPYMQPPHFTTYRRELAEASPPLVPYLGLTLQNLITLEQINPLFLSKVPKGMAATHKPEHGPIVNFWRCWKHFLIINFFVKQDSADGRTAHYDIKPDSDILDFIADFKTAYPDFALRELINRRRREAS